MSENKLPQFFKNLFRLFKSKEKLVEEIEIKEKLISEKEEELQELEQENIVLENRLQTFKDKKDDLELLEELGNGDIDTIIEKVEEYDKNKSLIKDLETENRELERENRKLKANQKTDH